VAERLILPHLGTGYCHQDKYESLTTKLNARGCIIVILRGTFALAQPVLDHATTISQGIKRILSIGKRMCRTCGQQLVRFQAMNCAVVKVITFGSDQGGKTVC